MAGINVSKVITGGLVAGVIVNASEAVLNVVVLADDWKKVMLGLNKPADFATAQIIEFNIMGFATGLLAVWLYAAIRPRFGAGRNTAVIAALATWIAAYVLAFAPAAAMDLYPARIVCISLIWGLIEIVIATIVGATLYKEE